MSDETIQNIADFKNLTGGDNLRIEFKHNSSFDYKFKGVLWNNCNKMPLFYGDKGKWVYDRIINIKCKNVIPKEKQDKRLLEKMKKEKNTIIKKALVALKQLIKDNFNFVYVKEAEENRKAFEITNSTFLSFIKECCVIDNDGSLSKTRTPRKTFKEAYASYVDSNYKGKGFVKWVDCLEILKEKYNCDLIKSNGTICLTNIKLNPIAVKDYIYIEDNNLIDLEEKQKQIEEERLKINNQEENKRKKTEQQFTVDVVNSYTGENFEIQDIWGKEVG